MCDKAHYEELEDRVTTLEKNQEVHDAESKVKFEHMEKTIRLQITCFKWVFVSMFTVLIILVLVVAYGAIGENGMNSVSHAASKIIK